MIKLIALDLDGTTLNAKGELSEETKKSFILAMEKGISIAILTGRCYDALPKEIVDFPGIRYAATSNGARIDDLRNNKIIAEHYINSKAILDCIKFLEGFNFMIEVFTEGSAYIEKKYWDSIADGGITYRYRDYVLRTRNPVEGLFKLMEERKDKIENINIFFEKEKEKSETWPKL
ncbi:MAG: HAD family hydrolase, partial [Anaerovoracaceae bacterium]